MQFRNIVLMLGLVALLVGVALAIVWARLPAEKPQPEDVAMRHPAILVVTTDIPQGAQLRADQIAWKEVPAADITPANIVRGQVSSDLYVGAVARRAFGVGEALARNALVLRGERNFLAATLTPGMYAVSLSVDPAQIVAGLLRPGDHVDVILSQALGDANGIANAVDGTVLRDIRVLAVDQWFAGTNTPAEAAVPMAPAATKMPTTITLEVTEVDAKRLLVATQIGHVTLALRSLEGSFVVSDVSLEGAMPVWSDEVSSAFRPARETSVASARGTVRIIRGSKVGTD
ncbi:Flp pilus assembly protein CpaB [Parvibaculum sedimenti]|uniref:Flp pilus assembly protein CpaB n=1 Tax=Parvibaculum sedimenti TaxID=2608632 RepID=A0A6N6VJ11_9HYPH|nr:Flp pilus assembly protein CpaB [Parvibaculum sedimenti]KAB7738884.1 Flp pilus assembly protein CpaB [Parvibaculum sedimenti]